MDIKKIIEDIEGFKEKVPWLIPNFIMAGISGMEKPVTDIQSHNKDANNIAKSQFGEMKNDFILNLGLPDK
ncbi:MAG: hypothetical protein LBB47_07985 [Spirochaetaceae bacterium]|nr:hypothetical protein [Spirochaetaceae bacterium]